MRQHSPAIMDCAEEPHSRHPAPGKYVAKLLTYGYVWENKINAVAFNGNIRDAMTKKNCLLCRTVYSSLTPHSIEFELGPTY